MYNCKKLLVSLFVTILLTGCAALIAPVTENIAKGVERYCEEPYSYRSVYRNTVNAELAGTGHQVHVHCSGDPAVEE